MIDMHHGGRGKSWVSILDAADASNYALAPESGLDETLVAPGDRLAEAGINATVLDVHTPKPFDAASVAETAREHQLVVTVEEHNIEGGLGTMVREAVAAAGLTTPVYKHGLYDECAIVDPPTHLYRYNGLDPLWHCHRRAARTRPRRRQRWPIPAALVRRGSSSRTRRRIACGRAGR